MGLLSDVRSSCREIAESARFVSIDLDSARVPEESEPPGLDPEAHYLEGKPGDVAAYLLTLDTVNFGSGWFPTLRKRPGRSGYFTVAWALADRFRAHGPWSNAALRALEAAELSSVLGQELGHPLIDLYAEASPAQGRFHGQRSRALFCDQRRSCADDQDRFDDVEKAVGACLNRLPCSIEMVELKSVHVVTTVDLSRERFVSASDLGCVWRLREPSMQRIIWHAVGWPRLLDVLLELRAGGRIPPAVPADLGLGSDDLGTVWALTG
jgi:hypothetical protein